MMKVIPTSIPEVLIVEPRVFPDERGYFLETWNRQRYADAGIDVEFVQDNLSFSRRGVLRGLHYQNPGAQGKLVSVAQGEVFDVAVDLRTDSPTFGRWVGATLSHENQRRLWVPAGFAHGFVVTSDTAVFAYKCTDYYAPQHERSLLWNDPEIGIRWPVESPIVSAKDAEAPTLRGTPPEALFSAGAVSGAGGA
jgi:dTDP-4-dehydrorhamnose 3,5-epimerase